MKNISTEEKFKSYLKASYPALAIRSHEEGRVIRSIINALSTTKAKINIYGWDAIRQLEKYNAPAAGEASRNVDWSKETNPTANYTPDGIIRTIREIVSNSNERNVFIMKDMHPYIAQPGVVRQIRNALDILKGKGNMLIFLGPVLKIPIELEKDIQILDFHLPDSTMLEGILQSIFERFNAKEVKNGRQPLVMSPEIKQATIEAAKGLTSGEANDAFALSIMENGQYNPDFILSVFEEKVKQVKKNGLLQYIKPDITFDNIGGLDGLKKWIRSRAKAYSHKAREYSLPYPKGILLAGKL
jgi:hypothetical protein